jgi:hypothetical protein
MSRAALAGSVAAAAWAASEPLVARAVRPPPGYSHVRLLGALVARGPAWRAVGLAAHLANGALFGIALARAGGRGAGRRILAAQAENVALWPALALVDRLHPDRRSGAWPPLLGNGRVFVYEAAVHLVFGTVLGALVRRPG